MIKTKNIVFAYSKTKIINGFTFEFKTSKMTSVLGPNGSGKTTIIKLMMKFLKGSGDILIDDKDIKEYGAKEFARKVAYVPQSISFPESTTVEEFIEFGRNPHNKIISPKSKDDIEKINYALRVCDIEQLRHKNITELSGGQKQICAIALTIAQDSDIIILDEPNSYLDINFVAMVMDLLKKLKDEEGKTIILSIHDINQASKYSDEIILMKKGNIIAQGTPIDVVTEKNMLNAYKIDAHIKDIKGHPVILDYERNLASRNEPK